MVRKVGFELNFLQALADSVQEKSRSRRNLFNINSSIVAGLKHNHLETTIGFIDSRSHIYSVSTRIALAQNQIHVSRRSPFVIGEPTPPWKWHSADFDLNDPDCIDILIDIIFDSYDMPGSGSPSPTIY